jgi:hypothetical protein
LLLRNGTDGLRVEARRIAMSVERAMVRRRGNDLGREEVASAMLML